MYWPYDSVFSIKAYQSSVILAFEIFLINFCVNNFEMFEKNQKEKTRKNVLIFKVFIYNFCYFHSSKK